MISRISEAKQALQQLGKTDAWVAKVLPMDSLARKNWVAAAAKVADELLTIAEG